MTTNVLPKPKPSTSTLDVVYCPECHGIAEVQWRDIAGSTDGPLEHVKIRCVNRHWFLMLAERLSPVPAEDPR